MSLLRRTSVQCMSRVRSARGRPRPGPDPPKPAHVLELSKPSNRAEPLRCPAAEMFYFYFQVRPCPAGQQCVSAEVCLIAGSTSRLALCDAVPPKQH